jgi:imidazolonepropionase-like amidohydrolase
MSSTETRIDVRIAILLTSNSQPLSLAAITMMQNQGGKTIMPGLIDAHMHIDLIGHGEYEDYYAFLGRNPQSVR